MSRRSGCPFNIKDYAVSIRNPVTDAFVRVKGLNRMSVEAGAETEDGRTGDSVWAEMFVKGRSVSGSIEGRPIADRVTGQADPGQLLMHQAAFNDGGCDGDQTLRVADAIGRAVEYDCVISKESAEADEDGETISWDWEGVGRPREIPYVQAAGLSFARDGATVGSMDVAVNATVEVEAVFSPSDASNQRFSYYIADSGVAAVNAVEDADISIRGVSAGETTLTIRSMNNGLIARLTVRVTG